MCVEWLRGMGNDEDDDVAGIWEEAALQEDVKEIAERISHN